MHANHFASRLSAATLITALALTSSSVAAAGLSICPAPHLPVVVTGGTLLTANKLPRKGAELHIEQGVVSWIGDAGTKNRPRAAVVIDAKGNSILPGLVDAHGHLSYLGQRLPDEYRNDRANKVVPLAARQLLRSGVTTARDPYFDLAGGPSFKRRACADSSPSPRLTIAGPAFRGGVSPATSSAYGWGIGDESDIRTKLDRIRAAGSEWVKVLAVDQVDPNVLAFIVSAAHERGLKVAAHGLAIEEARRALRAGVDSIEHVDWSEAAEYPQDVVALMKQARGRTFWVPTLSSFYRPLDTIASPQLLDDPILGTQLPASLWQELKAAGKSLQLAGDHLKTKAARPAFPRKFEQIRQVFGDDVLVGSEAGSENNFIVAAIWLEMAKWRELGVSPEEILRAATDGPARLLGAAQLGIGRLETGARGDVVVLDVDFLAVAPDVSAVAAVIKGGHVFVRDGQWIAAQ